MPTIAASRKHLVLVHGLCHGAWCWYKVMTHLRSAGHRVSAVDLGGSGVHPSRLDEIATFSDYIQPLVRFLESLSANEKVVLVGHSYGGLAISLAMERFPNIVSVAVFITAYMPNYRDPPALQMTQDKALANMLIRPCNFFLEDMSKDSLLTSDRYGSISRVYVVCEGDRVMDEEFQRFVIKDSPPKEVKSFPGVGHMIMLSHSQDISLYLQEIADRYP
ncbi:putative alpha/beta hydrolase-1 [Helianthus debilis subsp. tardiflorus]